jgi:tetratricopeptide (TPR) repeat protein
MEQARAALARADFPAAIELLGEVVVEDAANAEAWLNLGVCYLETQQPALALEALERAVRADPANATAHYVLGNAYGTTGQLEKAREAFRHALELDPQHQKAEESLVRVESLLESREHFRRGLEALARPSPSADDLNRAVRELVQSVALFDGSPAAEHLPECATRLHEMKREWPVELKPDSVSEPWLKACERAYQCLQFSNWVGLRAALEEALELRYEDAFVHHALGFALVQAGEIPLAVRAWLRVLELDSDYDFTRFGRVRRR